MSHEYKYAVNVKSRAYNRTILGEAHEVLGERKVNAVWDGMAGDFWLAAGEIAQEHGYGGIHQEGRSGGWLVPFYYAHGRSPSRKTFTVTQWLDDCYESEVPEHDKRFEVFKAEIQRMQKSYEDEFEAELKRLTVAELARREALLECGKGTN